jgi:hypothetical protein
MHFILNRNKIMGKKKIIMKPKDVMKITGKSKSQSSRIYHDILKHSGKEDWQEATRFDFMVYWKMTDEQLDKALED